MENDFTDAFYGTLDNSSKDLPDGFDYASLFNVDHDINAEDILEDPTLNNIPVFNKILSIIDTGMKISNMNFLNQTAAFFQEYYRGGELSQEAKEHLNQILSNNQNVDNEIGRVLILLNRNVDKIKSKYDAKYLLAYLNNQITSDEFLELLDITDRMFVTDFDVLYDSYKLGGIKESDMKYQHDRLISFGLLTSPYDHRGAILRHNDDDILLEITPIGEKMCEIIF